MSYLLLNSIALTCLFHSPPLTHYLYTVKQSLECIEESPCPSVNLSIFLVMATRPKWILMKLYIVLVNNIMMYMKDHNLGPKNIKGDNYLYGTDVSFVICLTVLV